MNRREMEAGKGCVTKGSIAPGKARGDSLCMEPWPRRAKPSPPGATTPAMVHIEGDEADSRDAHRESRRVGDGVVRWRSKRRRRVSDKVSWEQILPGCFRAGNLGR